MWNYTSTPPHAFIACTWTAVLSPLSISLLSPTSPAGNTMHALYWACLAYTPVVNSYITNRPTRHVSDLLVYTTQRTQKKSLLDSLRPPQIQQVLAWYRTRPSGLRGQRLALGIDSENKDLSCLHFNATKMCWAVSPRSFLADLGEKSAESCHSCSHRDAPRIFQWGES